MNRSLARLNYTRLSRWYDWFSIPEQHYKEIGCSLLNIHAGENILEIGFGTGRALIHLAASAGEGGKVFGIDLSDGMARVAQTNISRARLLKRIWLILGDAGRLPFKCCFFDAIFVSFTLELFEENEILVILKECKRVLHASGRLGLVAMDYKDCTAVKIYNWFHARIPSVVDSAPIDIRKIIERSGFKLVKLIEKGMTGLPVVILTAMKYG
jgi:ubiquinone/menaquinone biosynthesis C-methylase UbiE